MRTRLWSSVLGVVALLAILVGINMLVDTRLANAQLDVTQGRLYTLSSGTRAVLRALKEPVTLRLYYSPQLGSTIPVYGAYHDRVVAMLRQYAALSQGKVKLEFLDPEPYSETEDRALAAGVQAVPLDQNGTQVYFGLAGTNLLDDRRQIAFFKPEREPFLEYDLTKLVYEMSNPARPVIGVMSSLPLDGDPQAMMAAMRGMQAPGGKPWVSMLQLRQTFDVQTVPLDAQVIDPKIQVLLVAQAQNLSDATQYAIDQFVMRGGRLMVMVDPDCEAEGAIPGPDGQPPADTGSDLHRLFDAWGIQYDPKQVVAQLDGDWRVRAGGSPQAQAVDYPAWFNITRGLSHSDPATADLQQITVASAGFLSKKPGADIGFTPLLTSSPQSEVLPVVQVKTDPDPVKILANYQPAGGGRVIAARMRGVLKSAFKGPPDLPAGVQRQAGLPAYKAQTDGPADLVVVADTDILADRFWVRIDDFFGQQEATPFSDNGSFVSNLVGTLAGGDLLIGLRARGESLRPFTLVDNMQHAAETRFRRTQQVLAAQLTADQQKLDQLRQGSGGDASAVITPEQRAAIDAANREIRDTRRQQRDVQLQLREGIAALETQLRVFDIVLVPAVLTVLAIVLGVVRSRRRARARA
jgi:ABC-type uncharacterized transport system involved in gliding motility auxiliary subunit